MSESTDDDDRPEYVVKLAKIDEDDPDASEIYRTALPPEATALRNLAVEATVLTRLAETAVPIPAVSSRVTESGGELPPYILIEHIDGTVLSETDDSLSTAQQGNMIEQLGRYLALVHETFSFDRFGELEVINDELRVLDDTRRWQDQFDVEIEQAIERLEQTPLADLAHPARDWYHDRQGTLARSFESTVIHEDLNPLNVLVTTDSTPAISAIVDWEDVMAGPPELQVTIAVTLLKRQLADHDTPTIQARFVSGYRSVRDLPAGYEQRSALYEFRQWLQTFGNLQPDLDTADGRGAAVERHARTASRRSLEPLARAVRQGQAVSLAPLKERSARECTVPCWRSDSRRVSDHQNIPTAKTRGTPSFNHQKRTRLPRPLRKPAI